MKCQFSFQSGVTAAGVPSGVTTGMLSGVTAGVPGGLNAGVPSGLTAGAASDRANTVYRLVLYPTTFTSSWSRLLREVLVMFTLVWKTLSWYSQDT